MKYIAIDLGAESGRVMVGILENGQLQLHQMHRFPNQPVRFGDTLYWDFLRLWHDIQEGLQCAVTKYGAQWDGIGVDTWGVDFGLIDSENNLLGNPVHYRDSRTHGLMKSTFEMVPQNEIFASTGLQFLEINTLYQLRAVQQHYPAQLRSTKVLLMMADLFHYALSGAQCCEYTLASTSQMLDAFSRKWDENLIKRLELPSRILPQIVLPGTILGEILPSVSKRFGIAPGTPIIVPAAHDTASAVAAIPAQKSKNWAYLSSGTWSLMGVELDQPLINQAAQENNFTNEGGVDGTIRFLKNITGLWLVQECRRSLMAEKRDYSYAELTQMAANATSPNSWIDPDAADFAAPADMSDAINKYCARTGQNLPQNVGALIRICLESLALKYRWTLEKLEELTGRQLQVLHVVGGGAQNELLCQMTANCTGRTVITGPIEATASGNILVQAMARRQISDLEELRYIVRNSNETRTYLPETTQRGYWNKAYDKFEALIG